MKRLTTALCLTVALLFGCAGVCKSADYQMGIDAFSKRNYVTAFRELKPLAILGHAKPQENLGFMYENGKGVPHSNRKSRIWVPFCTRIHLSVYLWFNRHWEYLL